MYNYNNRGNILTVSKSGVLFQQYVYDEASQVKAEYNYAEKTAMTYVYDANGNIVSKTPYTNVTSSDLSTATQGTAIVYGYGDGNWSDKLTAYDRQTISYDSSGNPTSYRGETVTWNGRLMTSFTKDDRRYEYSYNSDGMRTVKKVYKNNELVYTYTYIWDGDVLLGGRMEVTDADEPITIRYLYDDSGELYGMDYNGNGYYGFIKNLQGDIVSIVPLDSESNVELNIEYDAWGKPIIKQASSAAEGLLMAMLMAVTNVGYRGYFYDFDTGLYYLRSRYYDPETGRFINADDLENCKPPKLHSLLPFHKYYDMNVFAYGQNNPINNEDSKGTVSKSIKKNEAWGDFYLAIVMFASYEYTQVEQSKKKGKIMVDFNHVDKGTYFYDVIDFYNKKYKGNIYDYIAYGALAKFKDSYELSSGKKPNRDFLFNDKCVSKEIEAHFKAYMWSMGKKSYYVPVYMYAYGVIQKGSVKAVVKSACKVADMVEADAEDNTGEAIAFGYYNGVRDKYKKTYKDPYYDKNQNKRRFSENAYEGWSNLEF